MRYFQLTEPWWSWLPRSSMVASFPSSPPSCCSASTTLSSWEPDLSQCGPTSCYCWVWWSPCSWLATSSSRRSSPVSSPARPASTSGWARRRRPRWWRWASSSPSPPSGETSGGLSTGAREGRGVHSSEDRKRSLQVFCSVLETNPILDLICFVNKQLLHYNDIKMNLILHTLIILWTFCILNTLLH